MAIIASISSSVIQKLITMNSQTTKILALGGLAGSILFFSISLISSLIYPGYSPVHNFISALGASGAETEYIMNYVGFIPSGFLFVLFSISLLAQTAHKLLPKIGSILIMAFGIGMVGAGIFSCDIGCPSDGSIEALIHDQISVIMFNLVILGILLFGFVFKKMPKFNNLSTFSFVTGVVSIILLAIMISTIESRNMTGLWQRLFLLSIFVWCSVVGIKIYRVDG